MKKYKTCGEKQKKNYWYLKTWCFLCYNIEHVATKCLQKSNFGFLFSLTSKTKKSIVFYKKSYPLTQVKNTACLIYLIKSYFHNSPVTFLIIDFGVTNHFLSN